MKKIMIITNGFEGTGGGKIASIMENYFSKDYKTVTLVSFYDGGIFPIKGKKINIGTFGKNGFPGRGYIALIPHIINTIRYIKKERPDYVIGIGSYSNFLGLCAKRFCNFKLLLTQHEHMSTKIRTDATLHEKLIFALNKELIGDTKIVCVSKEVMNDTIKFYNIPSNQAYTIYNGLDFELIKSLGNEPINIKDKYLINIGSLDDRKNQEMLIKAYAKTECKKDYKLLLLGEGPKIEFLINLAKELGIENNVIFAGFDKNPYKYLKNASMFCFTSKSEAFGLVLLESLILGVPIISVPVIGSNEVLNNGKYGAITEDWDIDNYSKLIDENIKKNHDKIINEGYKYAEENFEIAVMIKKYEEFLGNKL